MERELLEMCRAYFEDELGIPMNEDMKKDITNIARLAASMGFYLSKEVFKDTPGTITIKLDDPIQKNKESCINLGSISINAKGSVLSYNNQRLHNGIPFDSYCYVGIDGKHCIGSIQGPTKNFESRIETQFNSDGIVIDNNGTTVPFSNTSEDPLITFQEIERIHQIRVATAESLMKSNNYGMIQ